MARAASRAKLLAIAVGLVTPIPSFSMSLPLPQEARQSGSANSEGAAQHYGTVIPNLPCKTCGGGGTGSGFTLSPIPPEKFATSPGGVDTRTGRYQYDHLDLSLGDEHGLQLHRSVATDPLSTDHQRFGGFTSNWDIYVSEARVQTPEANVPNQYDYQVSISYAGKSATFKANYAFTDGFMQTSSDRYSSLTFEGADQGLQHPSIYLFTAYDGTKVTFRPIHGGDCASGSSYCAYASEITEPDGTHYALTYDIASSRARLRSVVSNRGYALLFEYNTANYPLAASKACALNLAAMPLPDVMAANSCPSGALSSTYSYSSGLLASFIDQGGVSTLIGPHAATLYNPGESTPYLTNTFLGGADAAYYIVSSQQFSDGRSYSYNWTRMIQNFTAGDVVGGIVTDNNGKTITVRYGQGYRQIGYTNGVPDYEVVITPSPDLVTDENGNSVTTEFVGLPQKITEPEGNSRSFTYDYNRNVTQTVFHAKPGSGLADISTSATFECTYSVSCAKPLTMTDARGKVTNYAYDPTHGGVIYELDPADASGVRPGKYYTYVQRYAWIKSGSGYAHASGAVWLPATMVTCRTTALNTASGTCGGGAADTITTAYDYGSDAGPNNLLLRGVAVTAGGVTERTCYGYNAAGDKIWEIKPNAGLASCS